MANLKVLTGVLLLLGTVAASAQSAPGTPPPPPGGPEVGMMHGHMEGHGGYMGMHRPMMSKAAAFRFRRDGAEIDIKCAADEPTKACVDAASILIDKVNSANPAH